ncbi:MAG: hypothetical protein JW862_18780 [Anaerolineales bacterium]|nr:hypothetical protein [Anaerolineales bacterium]
MATRKRIRNFSLAVVFLLAAALACNMPGVGERDETTSPEDAGSGVVAPSPEIDVSQPAGESAVEAAATDGQSVPLGFSRSNPYPIETEVVTPYWDFKVLEVLRGQEAYDLVRAQNPDAAPAPDGKEYLLVKVWVRCKIAGSTAYDLDLDNLFITGDRLHGYTDRLIDSPTPEFFYSDMYTAESLEGWIDVLVEVGEQDLMLVIDLQETVEGEVQPRELRYVALEPGATLDFPTELAGIAPNELGEDLATPAQIGETVVTTDWELTVLETRRGQAALDLALAMNARNNPPEEGLEYVAFLMRARRIGAQDVAIRASSYPLRAYVPGQGRNGSDQMEDPHFYLDPGGAFPYLNTKLFPGGQVEAWVIKQVPASYTPVIIQYIGFEETNFNDTRYFSLEP